MQTEDWRHWRNSLIEEFGPLLLFNGENLPFHDQSISVPDPSPVPDPSLPEAMSDDESTEQFVSEEDEYARFDMVS